MANVWGATLSEFPFRLIGEPTRGGIVAVCDHASNHVPEEFDLGIPPDAREKHIAWDIGAAGVAERLARRHNIPAFLAEVSRLVALGATRVHDKDEWGIQWTTLADPEGNEFCIAEHHEPTET